MMPTSSSAVLHTSPRVSVFVDGMNIMHRLRARGWEEFFDVGHFAHRIAGNRTLVGVFYFRPRPRMPPIETTQQLRAEQLHVQNIEAQLERDFGRYVRFGYMKKRRWGWEEKRTDVWIASQMVHDAAADAFDVAALVTADTDLVPAAEFVRMLNKDVELVMFPGPTPNVSELLEESSWVKPARKVYFQPYASI